jgi:LAO/AO transport system kinase
LGLPAWRRAIAGRACGTERIAFEKPAAYQRDMTTDVPTPAPAVMRTTASDLVPRLLRRERRAVADALTLLERSNSSAADLLKGIAAHLGTALVVGFTGPPGAGKSTLVNALIGHLRRASRTIAVLAVDPSSPVSGGAILGDRIRMTAALDDDGVFVRSLGARGALGGLTPAAVRMVDALDAAGFDFIFLETVGTGQSEIDIADAADVRVVIAAPGLGDDIQAMKAGLIEIADVIVVNKADRDGADRTAAQLAGALSLRANGQDIPVLKAAAISGLGIEEIVGAIERVGEARRADSIDIRRRRRARHLISRAAVDYAEARVRHGQPDLIERLADAVLSGDLTPEAAARDLLRS